VIAGRFILPGYNFLVGSYVSQNRIPTY